MEKQEAFFIEIGLDQPGAHKSQMFGKPCFKIGDKAFMSFFENECVFKLPPDVVEEALKIDGAKLFDPSGKGRAMKEWVQVPFYNNMKWRAFARAAWEYVRNQA